MGGKSAKRKIRDDKYEAREISQFYAREKVAVFFFFLLSFLSRSLLVPKHDLVFFSLFLDCLLFGGGEVGFAEVDIRNRKKIEKT